MEGRFRPSQMLEYFPQKQRWADLDKFGPFETRPLYVRAVENGLRFEAWWPPLDRRAS